ncbi:MULTISPECIES: hypothetical protein [Acidobacteriaceae]|uniref:hypothetical protein n=1 Tax=Acidobacteriaceae TaxID=204434 RepID=UPI00131AC7C2|nr:MULTISPECIES: hypothetical protein [Acidobacteriaceae]MDW5265257.1 hypothetical protein [Edaphobacter sp.]
MTLIVVAISAFGILRGSGIGTRLVFVLATTWAFAGQFLLHRGMWSASPPPDPTLSTGLEFYRHEIDKRQRLVRRVLQWSFGPVILSIGALIVVLGKIAKGSSLPISAVMPFIALIGIWIIAFFVRRLREQRKLLLEINEMNDIGKVGTH